MKLSKCWLSVCLGAMAPIIVSAQGFKVAETIKIGGTGGWDYLTADAQNRRLYVSHGTQVEVVDLDSRKVVGQISGMQRIHGIAVADDLGLGFITDGGAGEVVQFDLKTSAVQKKIKAGKNPDGLVYDPASKRVFAFNGGSQDATVINAQDGTVAGTVKLSGKPEFPVSDAKGSIYVNIEDKNEIIKFDAQSLAIAAHWPLAPCESPSGLAMDRTNRRLFSVCDGKIMAVVDADSGKVVATPAIGEGPDAAAFDAETHNAFSSNGQSGNLTVVHQDGPDKYSIAEMVPTARGARTMALDEKTHTIYLATADFGTAPAPSAQNAHPRPSIQPGSFKLVVVTP